MAALDNPGCGGGRQDCAGHLGFMSGGKQMIKRSWLRGYLLLALLAVPWVTGFAPSAAGQPCDPQSACFDVSLTATGLVGDFYIDGKVAATGVSQARVVGAPDVPHLIEVKNIQEPAAPGNGDLFNYATQSVTEQAKAGWVWRLTFYPQRNYLKGTLTYVCNPSGRASTDSVVCQPAIDGNPMPDVAPGASASYYLTPGAHTIHTTLSGTQAGNWSQTARDDSVTIYAARISWLQATFELKGVLKISLYPAGIVADLYVDGTLAATQSGSLQVLVTPRVPHLVEAKNVTDPAANSLYKYGDASQKPLAYPAGTAYVSLRPVKVWLTGALSVACVLNRKAATDDAHCSVTVDNAAVGTVGAGTRGTFNLSIGSHAVGISVVGTSAGN
jgi:hypothetical protein